MRKVPQLKAEVNNLYAQHMKPHELDLVSMLSYISFRNQTVTYQVQEILTDKHNF